MFNRIILFSNRLGQRKIGVEKTPNRVKQFLDNNNNFYEIKCRKKPTLINLSKNLQKLYTVNSNIHYPKVNIGGDHSMAIATIADSLNKYPDLKVLWFDAHADINTISSSCTKNYHGMPLSFLTGLDYYKKFNFINNKLLFNRLLYVGIRDIDNYEKKVIESHKIKYISVNEIRTDIIRSTYKVLDFMGDNPVHVSFDVDVMDPIIIASTGTRVKNGLYFDETKYILDMIKDKNIVNMDITELNLDIGNNNQKFKSLTNTLNLFENYIN